MKGADQCPRCGSRRWLDCSAAGVPPPTDFYAANTRACINCHTLWEPFDPADLLDPKREPLGAFHHPCNNCAFRKGSPEQRDPEAFARMRAKLGWLGASFYCHKGVPLDPGGEDGFAYPKDASGELIVKKARLCRGYLNQLSSFPLDRKLSDDDGVPWVDPVDEVQTP